MPTRLTLRTEILAMQAADLALRDKLLHAGLLSDGYHPEMAAVHARHAARMREIFDQHGWPTRTLVGVDGEEAAWLVVQHSIGDPELQRRALSLLEHAVATGDAPAWQLAYLTDRIGFFEGRPQRYGTHFDFDEEGYNAIYRLEDPDHVDELRRSVGLGPLEGISRDGQTPKDRGALRRYRAKFEAWARSVGWRSE